MKLLGVSLTLCVVLTLSQARPSMTPNLPGLMEEGLCNLRRQNCSVDPSYGDWFCPRCDTNGNFLPQQCSWLTGSCWCVNIVTGEDIPGTSTMPGETVEDCENNEICPDGWSMFGKRCFIFIDAPKTWTAAEFYCQFEGAHLASVHSSEEYRFIQSLSRGDSHDFPEAWIGGNNIIQPGFWMWSDGSEFNYENWVDDAKPFKNPNRCLRINYGAEELKWYGSFCFNGLPFVCSKKPEHI